VPAIFPDGLGASSEESALSADEFAFFVQVSGLQGPLDLEVLEPGKPKAQRHSFAQPALIFGRDERCDLCLNDPMVSRRHAYLQVIAGHAFVIDLGSRTGIIAGSEMLASGWLHPDRDLRIGGCTVRFLHSAMDQTPMQSVPEMSKNPLDRQTSLSDPGRACILEFGRGHPPWRLNRVLTLIGRATNCKVRIDDMTVSRYHAALLQTPQGIWLIDLCSREGTFLNGTPIRWGRLEDGSQLRIGRDYVIRVSQRPDGNLSLSQTLAARATPLPFQPSVTQDIVPIKLPHLPLPTRPADAEPAPARFSSSSNHPEHPQLMSIIQQLNLMNQQMFDQFHQTLLTMAQMFCTMQREQMTLVRQELDRVQELTGELQEIQATLKKRVSSDCEAAAAGLDVPTYSTNADAGIEAPNEVMVESALLRGTAANPPKAPVPVSEPIMDPDIHMWLTQRVAALEQERQGRLRKLIGMILGRG
jgi:pSer/pThr/pTyr-binding forkhead associated (FHA) protein